MPTPQNGQPHSIRRLLPTNRLSVFEHFVGLALKGLNLLKSQHFRNIMTRADLENLNNAFNIYCTESVTKQQLSHFEV